MTRVDDYTLAARVVQATVVSSYLAVSGQHPVLVASLVVARPHVHWFVVVLGVYSTVNAHGLRLAAHLRHNNVQVRYTHGHVEEYESNNGKFCLQMFSLIISLIIIFRYT